MEYCLTDDKLLYIRNLYILLYAANEHVKCYILLTRGLLNIIKILIVFIAQHY